MSSFLSQRPFSTPQLLAPSVSFLLRQQAIYPQLISPLEKRRKQAQILNGGKIPPDTRVFAVKDAKKAIENACSRLGLPRYSSRSFRRLFITSAIEKGVDVKVIAAWQGHKDGGKLILDTYSHVRPVHSENMARLMTGY